ncbi:hypothetical protein BGZ49_002896 [Haplosporangium sp. Z 27]|nr:hypothetical protein BGZ49_002896 [Haplosporangium sp. Z 27]
MIVSTVDIPSRPLKRKLDGRLSNTGEVRPSARQPCAPQEEISVEDTINDKDSDNDDYRENSDQDDDSDHCDNSDHYDNSDDDNELPLVAASSPFADLVVQLYQKYNHPRKSLAPFKPPLTGALAYLYNVAANNLHNWEDLEKVTKKSTLVAMSGILNTMDSSMADCQIFQEVKQACYDPDFSAGPVDVQTLLDEIQQKMGQRADINTLHEFCLEQRRRNAALRSEYSDQARIISVVEYLITLIKQNTWASTISEGEYVSIWRHIFGILLQDTVATRMGELSVKETKKEKLVQETTFALKDHNIRGRKVDLLFQAMYKDHKGKLVRTNLAVFEAKTATATVDTLQVQARKNIRPRAYLYTIKKFGDVYGAGSVTDKTVRLPTSEWELFAMLRRPDLILLLKVANRLQSLDSLVRMAAFDQEEEIHHYTMTSTLPAYVAQDSPSATTVWSPSTAKTPSAGLKRPRKRVVVVTM